MESAGCEGPDGHRFIRAPGASGRAWPLRCGAVKPVTFAVPVASSIVRDYLVPVPGFDAQTGSFQVITQ